MSANIRKELNHTPEWYRERCGDEDGGNGMYRALFNSDMKRIEADDDLTLNYEERLTIYEEAWAKAQSDPNGAGILGEMEAACIREKREGFTPQSQYSQGPFLAISRIMEKHGLSTTVVRQFVAWKAKNANATKARLAKVPKESRSAKAARLKKEQADKIFGKGKWTPSAGVDF